MCRPGSDATSSVTPRFRRGVSSKLASYLIALVLAGCGEDEPTSPEAPSGSGNVGAGWVKIKCPTGSVTTGEAHIGLWGYAFVSPALFTCCPLDPAVTVTWRNDMTGTSGTAWSLAYVVPLFQFPVHQWSASAWPLAVGANLIRVTAADSAGNIGRAEVTVTYDPNAPVYSCETTP